MTFVVAAASNFPVLILTIYWKRFTQVGAITGMVSGLIASLVFVLLGPHIMNPDGGWISREAVISLYNPGVIAIPIGFLGAYLGTIVSKKHMQTRAEFRQFYIKGQTGIPPRRESS